MESTETLRAECVATVDEYPGDLLANIEFLSAIIAKVKAPGLVIGLKQVLRLVLLLLQLDHLPLFFSLGSEQISLGLSRESVRPLAYLVVLLLDLVLGFLHFSLLQIGS